jgi:hypothetical protein
MCALITVEQIVKLIKKQRILADCSKELKEISPTAASKKITRLFNYHYWVPSQRKKLQTNKTKLDSNAKTPI